MYSACKTEFAIFHENKNKIESQLVYIDVYTAVIALDTNG